MKGLVAFARNRLGVALWPNQALVLDDWAASGKRKAVLCLGRRSGKGLCAAVAAIHNAVVPDYSDCLRPGETRFIVVVATRQEQAREFIRVVRELLRAAPDPNLGAMVDSDASTQDEVAFRNGVVVRAMPSSSRSTRGLAISLLVLDEVAHMVDVQDGFSSAKKVYQALLPSTAQFGDRGYVMLTSSPSWPSGLFHELFQAGQSGAAPDVFVAQRATWDMNPSITRESLSFEFLSDPESANVEFAAQFAQGGGAYVDATTVHAAVITGRKNLPPVPGVRYVAAADPAFAAGGDAFTFCIAHKQDEVYVIDRLESWRGGRSPLNSDMVLDEIADLAKAYRVSEVVSDQFAVVPLADGMQRRGIFLRPQALTAELKADIFSSLKRNLNLGRVELLDNAQLVSELAHLEIRPTPSGKPRIQGAGSRDDLAMVTATAIHALEDHIGTKFGGFFAWGDEDWELTEKRNRDENWRCCGNQLTGWGQCPSCYLQRRRPDPDDDDLYVEPTPTPTWTHCVPGLKGPSCPICGALRGQEVA